MGKFGERYANEVNMAWLWARFKARTTRLGTFQGGFQAFSDRLRRPPAVHGGDHPPVQLRCIRSPRWTGRRG